VILLHGPIRAAGPDLLFPGDGKPLRLRLDIRVDGQGPEAVWATFLDRLFDYFDRDGDGFLSAVEGARVFPLPLAGGREAALDFPLLDADSDGKGSRAELKAFYRRAGFSPVVATVLPPTAHDLQMSELLFRHLDSDADGRLTPAELRKAAALLKKLDQNEDEVVTAAELLSPPPDTDIRALRRSSLEVVMQDEGTPAAVLHLSLGKGQQQPTLVAAPGGAIQAAATQPGGPYRLRMAADFCTVVAVPGDTGAPFETARQFYLAQFRAGLGNRPFIDKKQLEQDPGLQVLAGLFEHADRDADGKLTFVELETFLDLIEQGVVCQTVVTVADRGRSLFDLFDTDRNGRLDLRELNAAARLPASADGERRTTVARDEVPRQFRLRAGRGVSGTSFGPVPLAGQARRPAPAPVPLTRGPRWFRAMDRNGDGYLSPQEFLGSPELFRRLDADGDGSIAAEEAERANAQQVGPQRPAR
jgi:Ca2+-binding EF-hand superfamily protein